MRQFVLNNMTSLELKMLKVLFYTSYEIMLTSAKKKANTYNECIFVEYNFFEHFATL